MAGLSVPVSLLITDAVYLRNMKIDAEPDLSHMTRDFRTCMGPQRRVVRAIVTIHGIVAGLPVVFPKVRVVRTAMLKSCGREH